MEGHTYRYFRGEPLFPFGFGLSYTAFAYGRPKIRGKVLLVPVTNTGRRDGTEVVQLYVSRPGDTEGPVITLRDWRRVSIPAGETVNVRFELRPELFEWWSEPDCNMKILPGSFKLHVGSSSGDLQSVDYFRK